MKPYQPGGKGNSYGGIFDSSQYQDKLQTTWNENPIDAKRKSIFVKNESVESTRRALARMREAEDVGQSNLVKLNQQSGNK